MGDEELVGEAMDPEGNRVVVSAAIWRGKIVKNHHEMSPYLAEVLRAINSPHLIVPDPDHDARRQHFLRGAGPSRWLLAVVSYEEEAAFLVTAFPRRKDPDSWGK